MQTTRVALTMYIEILTHKDHEIRRRSRIRACVLVHLHACPSRFSSFLLPLSLFFLFQFNVYIIKKQRKSSLTLDVWHSTDQNSKLFFFFPPRFPWRHSGYCTRLIQCISPRVAARYSLVYIMPHWCNSVGIKALTKACVLRRRESRARRRLIHQT